MAGCGYMTASVYQILYIFIIGISFVPKASLTDYHPGWSPEFACAILSICLIIKHLCCIRLFVGICNSVTVPVIRFFSTVVAFFLVVLWSCYQMGRVTSITTMNYSVTIFVYSRMIRYPDNAITELQYSRISLFWYPEANVARTLPDTDISKSPFTEVYKYQTTNGDDEKTIRRMPLPVILHLQMCKSSNPLMDNRACKGQISRIFASLFPNYGRKLYGYGEISILLWGERPTNT